MTEHCSPSNIIVEVSRVVAYSMPPGHWREEPIKPVEVGLDNIAWRFPRAAPVKLFRAAPTCVLPSLPDNPEFRELERTDFWLACEGLPGMVEVTRVRLACPRSVINDPRGLSDWASKLESQSDVAVGVAAPTDPRAATAVFSRNSDFICVVEAEDALESALGQEHWCAVSPQRALRRELQAPCSDFWIIKASSWGGRRTTLDAATVLYLFAFVQLKLRILTDTVVNSIVALSGSADEHVDWRNGADLVAWLAAPDNRLKIVEAHRTFLLAKLCFDQSRVIKYADLDGPVYETMLERSGSRRLVAERERDFDSLTRLVSEAALHREVSVGIRRTNHFGWAITALGVLGTIAGVLQAVDRSDSTLPLSSEASLMRLAILVGMLTLLGLIMCLLLWPDRDKP